MSANLTTRQFFSPSCPAGGTWWACGYGTYFVGCCARDPCDITCAQGNLYPGAFDPKAYGKFPDATCGTGSKFYTCASKNETFWGCCKTNPCAQSGCPDGDLEPAILNRDDLVSAYHATGAPTASASSKKSDDATPVAAIAGGTAGGVFAAAVVVGIFVWWLCLRRKRKARRAGDYEETRADGGMGEIHHKNSESAPPSYTSPNPNFTHTFYGPQSQHDSYSHPNYAQNPGDPYLSPMGHSPHDTVAAHNHTGPQELPLSTPSTPNTPGKFRNHKSMYGHSRGPSELSGDEPHNELESSHPASPELDGSTPVRKWSWDDNKEKLQTAQNGNQSHDAEVVVVRRSPPMPRWKEARWEEQGIDERSEYTDPRQRLLQAVRREREEEERHQRGLQQQPRRRRQGEEDENEDERAHSARIDEEEEDGESRRSNIQHSGRPRSPQGLGLLDVMKQDAADKKSRKSGESSRK